MSNRNTEGLFCQTPVKCRFFAQYWGVKCMYVGGVGLVEIGTGGWNLKHPDFFLELKPLSKITDEDCEFISINIAGVSEKEYKLKNINVIKEMLCKYLSDFKNTDSYILDYLRSKGYALPFMEYSVDELLELGWARLV
jgi:hypothetical protein